MCRHVHRSVFAVMVGGLLLGAVSSGASAQSGYPMVEVFGGYSHLPADGNDFPRQTSGGFQASVAYNLTRWFGIAGEIGGQYNTATNLGVNWEGVTAHSSVYEYLVAPRFTMRTRPVNLFVHGLVGAATGRSDIAGFADTGMAFGAGGGLDVNLSSRIALRAQLDLLFSTADIVEDNARLGVGMVVRFTR